MRILYKHIIVIATILFYSCNQPEVIVPTTVETLGVEEVTDYSAFCRGRIIERGSGTISDYGIELNDGNGYVKYSRTISSNKEFGVKLSGLQPNKSYVYRAYVNDGTVRYGEEKQFVSGSPSKTIVQVDPITITDNSVIIYFGLADRYKEWGVHYSETGVTSDAPFKRESLQSNLVVDGLKPETKYNILPFTVDENSQKTYLAQLSFTTTDGTVSNELTIHNFHPVEQIRFVKYNVVNRKEPYYSAYRGLITEANMALEQEENALADFYIPRFYGTPEEQEIHKKNMDILRRDSYAAYVSALAYRLSGNEKYAEKAIYFLNAWARINKSYSGANDAAQAMTRVGTGLVIAGELMSNTGLWSNSDHIHFINWVTNVYEKAGDAHLTRYNNNVRDWARFGCMLSASIKGDRVRANQITNMIKSDLFDNIAPDGHMPKEVSRGNNGVWYTYFSLAPLTAASWLSYNITGENIFEMESAEGASIKKAADYLLYYSINPDEWPWEGNIYVGTPANWPGNLYEALYGIYNDKSYQDYSAAGRPIIYNGDFTWSFPTLMPVSLTGYN